MLWTISGHQSIWGAVTRAVRTPSDAEDTLQSTTLRSTTPLAFNITAGDGVFTSETDVSYEIGYRQLIIPSFSVDLATFYNNYDHLQESGTGWHVSIRRRWMARLTPSTFHQFVNRNGLAGTTKGFELAPSWKPTAWWKLQGILFLSGYGTAHQMHSVRTRPA